MKINKVVIAAKSGASKSIKLHLTSKVRAATADKPTIKRILAIFEPTTLAVTISLAPFKTAAIDEASSGKEVPMATIVTPIIKGEIFKARPIFSAFSTSQSADFTNKARLAIKIIIQMMNIILIQEYMIIP